MKIVLGLNDTDIEALRTLRVEQSARYDSILEETEGRELTETEGEELDAVVEKLDVLAKIEGVIDNQIELDKERGERTGLMAHEIESVGTMVQELSNSEREGRRVFYGKGT